jgi:hypothetical protein
VEEADQCPTTGINCTIPTTTLSTSTTQAPTTTERLTTTQPTTTQSTTTPKLTPPPKFTRYTVKSRNLPRWKSRPISGGDDVSPPAPNPDQVKKSAASYDSGDDVKVYFCLL